MIGEEPGFGGMASHCRYEEVIAGLNCVWQIGHCGEGAGSRPMRDQGLHGQHHALPASWAPSCDTDRRLLFGCKVKVYAWARRPPGERHPLGVHDINCDSGD